MQIQRPVRLARCKKIVTEQMVMWVITKVITSTSHHVALAHSPCASTLRTESNSEYNQVILAFLTPEKKRTNCEL